MTLEYFQNAKKTYIFRILNCKHKLGQKKKINLIKKNVRVC